MSETVMTDIDTLASRDSEEAKRLELRASMLRRLAAMRSEDDELFTEVIRQVVRAYSIRIPRQSTGRTGLSDALRAWLKRHPEGTTAAEAFAGIDVLSMTTARRPDVAVHSLLNELVTRGDASRERRDGVFVFLPTDQLLVKGAE
jgi:hypothetical protein